MGNDFAMNKAGGPMTTQLTIPADVVRADGFEIARRLEAHARAARGALADQTRRALASDSRIWSAWCAERNISALPAEPTAVVAFVDAQAVLKSPATVRRYIATIAHMHRAAELADPTKAEAVRLAIIRLVRAKGSRQRQAAPLGELAVERILATQPKTLSGLRNVALMLVMRDLLARRSEAAALRIEDLTFAEDGSATVLIARSKTDQEGAGAVRWLSPRTAAALRSWLDCAGLTTGPMFRAIRKNGVAKPSPLEPGEIARLLKEMATRAGIDSTMISGHSARVGMSQDLVAAGADLAAVMQAGRWKTPTMPARYSEHLLAAKGAVAQYYQRRGGV
jgi:site-specific recombinase XerD